MSLRDVCDLAYVLLIDQMERQVLADRQVAAVWMAAGMSDIQLPTVHERRVAFDTELAADPADAVEASGIDADQMELRRVLGVA